MDLELVGKSAYVIFLLGLQRGATRYPQVNKVQNFCTVDLRTCSLLLKFLTKKHTKYAQSPVPDIIFWPKSTGRLCSQSFWPNFSKFWKILKNFLKLGVLKSALFDQNPCFALQVLEHLLRGALKLARQSKVFGQKVYFLARTDLTKKYASVFDSGQKYTFVRR